ncbi:hypothetical protein L1987_08616 [Smallanthus sonchifolius]|uniref:Uncharacterized protein n=1 Tax=Smallanthus sonchifolius TaxID=185202 RepID=A0ACB9JND7_9ASTR|nr:hypothetical protein L1987_08616 [Smallanthus sonchifolius]
MGRRQSMDDDEGMVVVGSDFLLPSPSSCMILVVTGDWSKAKREKNVRDGVPVTNLIEKSWGWEMIDCFSTGEQHYVPINLLDVLCALSSRFEIDMELKATSLLHLIRCSSRKGDNNPHGMDSSKILQLGLPPLKTLEKIRAVLWMLSVNAVLLLVDIVLNHLRIIHACVSMWWPYSFLDLSSPYAPICVDQIDENGKNSMMMSVFYVLAYILNKMLSMFQLMKNQKVGGIRFIAVISSAHENGCHSIVSRIGDC